MHDHQEASDDAGAIRLTFAITTADGYEIEVEAVAGGPVFLRLTHPHGNGVQAALDRRQAAYLATAVELGSRSAG